MPELYYTDLCLLSPEAKLRPLSLYRERGLANVTNPRVREQGICAERLLEYALRQRDPALPLPLDILQEENGRPVLRGSHTRFSLSHSGTFVACALADCPVGLDLQVISPFRVSLAERCFTPAEREAFFPGREDDRAFTLLWTLKESYLKMTGQGLRLPMRSFSVLPDSRKGFARTEDAAFWYREENAFCLALCVPQGQDPYPSVFSSVTLS